MICMSSGKCVMAYIPVEVYDEMLILCEKEYRSMSNLMVVAMRYYIENKKGGEK
ncbi:hypothetical protein ES708_19693 [subsurface metagenome]